MHTRRFSRAAVVLAFALAPAFAQAPAASAGQKPFHLLEATVDDVSGALKSGQITCLQLVDLYLKRIQAYDKAGPAINALQTVNPRALEEAGRLDAAYRSSGPVGPLHCIPTLVKDQVETKDMATTYGSAVFKDFIPNRDATVVTRLHSAGAVILGKTTMGEFASGYFGSASGLIRNAYDPSRHASGSSGGAGLSLTANFGVLSIGEDTGGSIRGPAAVSSLVGLRPTTPLVSRFGMMPARPSNDTLGPMARTVRDAAVLLDVIAGFDPNDPITAYSTGQVPMSYTSFLSKDGLKGMRLGVIREPMDARANPESADYKKVHVVFDRAVQELKALGAEIVESVTIPDLKDRIKRVYVNNQFETQRAVDTYLSGHPNAPVKSLHDILLSGKVAPSRAKALMNEIGRSTDQPGYLDVLLTREDTRQVVLSIMASRGIDALIYATFDHQPEAAPLDFLTNATIDTAGIGNNRQLSPVLGFPAITVPAGFTSDGLPVGLEFMARPFAEGLLFKIAYAYEQGSHHRKPPASTPALRGEP